MWTHRCLRVPPMGLANCSEACGGPPGQVTSTVHANDLEPRGEVKLNRVLTFATVEPMNQLFEV